MNGWWSWTYRFLLESHNGCFIQTKRTSKLPADPNSEDGALGKVQAPIAVEATKRANQRNELVLIAGLPGDPYTGGQWIGIPMDFITKEYA